MKIPQGIKIYGDFNYRDKNCRKEWSEQKEFFGFLKARRAHWYAIAIHPKNEGERTGKEAAHAAELGCLNTGASDIIIPARIPFVCEIKREDHTLSAISKPQIAYLNGCKDAGAFTCIALGCNAAWSALLEWEKISNNS